MGVWEDWNRAIVSGHIKYLYEFEQNVFDYVGHIRLCTGREPVTYENIYYPETIKHNELSQSISSCSGSVLLPASPKWLKLFFKYQIKKIRIRVFRYREELNEGRVIFTGVLDKVSLSGLTIRLDFKAGFDISGKLVVYWTQRYCNHVPYNKFCGLKRSELKVVVPKEYYRVDGSNRIVLLNYAQHFSDLTYWEKAILIYSYNFNYFEDLTTRLFNSSMIFNMEVQGNDIVVITKNPLVDELAKGDYDLEFLPNCNLDIKRCRDLFNNLPYACGFPDMPIKPVQLKNMAAGDNHKGYIGEPCE